MSTTTTTIFMRATRLKLRFPSFVGLLTVEDLWVIPLTTTKANKPSIENIGASLLARQQELQGQSILASSEPSLELRTVDLQVAILRKVGEVRQSENRAKTQAAAQASERDRLDKIIAAREEREIPLEELKARRELL